MRPLISFVLHCEGEKYYNASNPPRLLLAINLTKFQGKRRFRGFAVGFIGNEKTCSLYDPTGFHFKEKARGYTGRVFFAVFRRYAVNRGGWWCKSFFNTKVTFEKVVDNVA